MRAAWLAIAIIPACTDAPAARPPDDAKPAYEVTPSDQRATANIIAQAYAHGDGTVLTIEVELDDRLVDGPTIQLVGADHLIATVGTARVELAEDDFAVPQKPEIIHTRYRADVLASDPRQVDIDLDRADGSSARITIPIPPAFAIATPPPHDVKYQDSAPFTIAPASASDEWGHGTIECIGTTTTGTNDLHVDPSGAGNVIIAAAGGGASGCDASIALEVSLTGTQGQPIFGSYDPAFGNAEDHPIGSQIRSVGVHYWP